MPQKRSFGSSGGGGGSGSSGSGGGARKSSRVEDEYEFKQLVNLAFGTLNGPREEAKPLKTDASRLERMPPALFRIVVSNLSTHDMTHLARSSKELQGRLERGDGGPGITRRIGLRTVARDVIRRVSESGIDVEAAVESILSPYGLFDLREQDTTDQQNKAWVARVKAVSDHPFAVFASALYAAIVGNLHKRPLISSTTVLAGVMRYDVRRICDLAVKFSLDSDTSWEQTTLLRTNAPLTQFEREQFATFGVVIQILQRIHSKQHASAMPSVFPSMRDEDVVHVNFGNEVEMENEAIETRQQAMRMLFDEYDWGWGSDDEDADSVADPSYWKARLHLFGLTDEDLWFDVFGIQSVNLPTGEYVVDDAASKAEFVQSRGRHGPARDATMRSRRAGLRTLHRLIVASKSFAEYTQKLATAFPDSVASKANVKRTADLWMGHHKANRRADHAWTFFEN